MSASDRRAVVALLQVLWSSMIVLGIAFAIGAQNPRLALVAAAGLCATLVQIWWLVTADHWHGFRPPAGASYEVAAPELPLLADHRDVFGAGQARHVVSGPGYVAFDLVRGARRRWFYAVPLRREHAAWHVRPESVSNAALNSPMGSLRRLYEASGHVPQCVESRLVADPLVEIDLRLVDNLLIATVPGMSGHRFAEWSMREGTLIREIANALDAEPAPEPTTPELPARMDPRNSWAPDVEADAAVWTQPPSAGVAGRAARLGHTEPYSRTTGRFHA